MVCPCSTCQSKVALHGTSAHPKKLRESLRLFHSSAEVTPGLSTSPQRTPEMGGNVTQWTHWRAMRVQRGKVAASTTWGSRPLRSCCVADSVGKGVRWCSRRVGARVGARGTAPRAPESDVAFLRAVGTIDQKAGRL